MFQVQTHSDNVRLIAPRNGFNVNGAVLHVISFDSGNMRGRPRAVVRKCATLAGDRPTLYERLHAHRQATT